MIRPPLPSLTEQLRQVLGGEHLVTLGEGVTLVEWDRTPSGSAAPFPFRETPHAIHLVHQDGVLVGQAISHAVAPTFRQLDQFLSAPDVVLLASALATAEPTAAMVPRVWDRRAEGWGAVVLCDSAGSEWRAVLFRAPRQCQVPLGVPMDAAGWAHLVRPQLPAHLT